MGRRIAVAKACNKTACEKGTVPFCCEDSAKLGQSPAILLPALIALAVTLWAAELRAQTFAERIATGFSRGVGFTAAPGDPNRGFVIEAYTGRIEVVDLTTNTVLATPLLTVTGLLTSHAEQGLLGLAFDPDFANNGYFYVNYTADDNTTHIERYSMVGDPMTSNVADPGSVHTILRIPDPNPQHNAGWMDFGPNDGYFYISTGDGGNCPGCGPDSGPGHTEGTGNAQDITDNLWGKILRIDVHGADAYPDDPDRNYAIVPSNPFVGEEGDDEIWAYGLRNPWRSSFDRETGDLWIGDVGGSTREEVNFQRADWAGGANYGWRLREGNIATPQGGVGGDPPADHVPPVYDYSHFNPDPMIGGTAVIGGYVYRGSVDEFVGHYFFGDFNSTNIWKLDPNAIDIPSSVTWVKGSLPPNAGSLGLVTSFGEDANGELYMIELGSGNELFRFSTTSRDAVWNGNNAAAGLPGNGGGWNDANNWTRGGVVDSAFVAKDTVQFVAGSSQAIVDLQGDRSVGAVEFHAPFTLQNNTLRVYSGNISVAAGVVARIESDLSAESVHHALRKLGSGTLIVDGSAGQTVVKSGTLGGSGTFDHLSIRQGGTVAPGTLTGTMEVDNSFNMAEGAILAIEIGGTAPGTQFDLLDVGGVASLAGELKVSLIGGYQPEIGDEFKFLTAAGGVNGIFTAQTLPSLPSSAAWRVWYEAANVALVVVLAGDFNSDGFVDAADYVIWRKGLGTLYNQAHYNEWRANFGATTGSGSEGGSDLPAVPEPATTCLLLSCIVGASMAARSLGRVP
jgi:glucose/arabinose dehydrogenase